MRQASTLIEQSERENDYTDWISSFRCLRQTTATCNVRRGSSSSSHSSRASRTEYLGSSCSVCGCVLIISIIPVLEISSSLSIRPSQQHLHRGYCLFIRLLIIS